MITWWSSLTRKGNFKGLIDSIINWLAEIDEKYKSLEESKKRQIDGVFRKIQDTLLRYYPSEDYELSQEVVIKPYWVLRLFLSKTSVAHVEIKKLILFLREVRQKFLDRTTSESERDKLSILIRNLNNLIDEISPIINS